MRAFVALDVDDASRARLARLSAKLEAHAPRGVRFLAPPTFHLTLKFLGSVDDDAARAFGDSLGDLASRAPAASRVASVGAFPADGAPGRRPARSTPDARARIFVAHLEDPGEALAQIARSLDALAAPLGVAREERAYKPHVTLARARLPLDARAWLAPFAQRDDAVRFTSLVLFESDTRADGPVYTPLASYPLA